LFSSYRIFTPEKKKRKTKNMPWEPADWAKKILLYLVLVVCINGATLGSPDEGARLKSEVEPTTRLDNNYPRLVSSSPPVIMEREVETARWPQESSGAMIKDDRAATVSRDARENPISSATSVKEILSEREGRR